MNRQSALRKNENERFNTGNLRLSDGLQEVLYLLD
jgi:hypothetical protein